MARYIDAERLKRTFASGIRVYDGMCKIDDVLHNIENEPTADVVEVKHGKWKIKRDDYDYEYMKCSCCKEEFYPCDSDTVDETPNYCPYCGAKMDGGKTE